MATQTVPQFPAAASLVADSRAQMIKHVDGEIAGLKAELAILQETRRALSGQRATTTQSTPAARPGNGQRTATRQRQRSHTAAATVSEEAVLDAIRAGKGDQSPKLAQVLGATPETILRRLKALETKGLIRREGERANTRWAVGAPAVS